MTAWRRFSLAVKLALLCGGLTVVMVGAALLAMRGAAVRDVRGVIVGELDASQRAWRGLQEQRLTLLLATSALVSTSPTLRAALATAHGEAASGTAPRAELAATIQREADRVFGDLDRDVLLVTDDRGNLLAGASRGSLTWRTVDLSRLPAVQHAINDIAPTADSSFGVMELAGEPVQVGCVAIVVAGYPVGVLVLGDRLERVVPRAASAGSALLVTVGDRLLQASESRLPVEDLQQGLRGAEPASGVYSLHLGSSDYLVATLPLGDTQDGQRASVHLLRSVTDALQPLDHALTRDFLLAGAIAVLLAGLGAAAASRSVLAPLSRFVGFLRGDQPAAGRGSYADPSAAVEVRTLIDAYNGQTRTLAAQHAELARANQDLRAEIGERERAERALRDSEAALRQSQKLEALGRLAGGVAHDFNNLLQVMGSATHFLRTEIHESPSAAQDLADIEAAVQRAKSLVQQLLAFSRKQVLQPRVLVLNEVIVGLVPLARRIGGPMVEMTTSLAPDLAYIRADPGQLEQVLMNLVVNAVDAMPGGGRIHIETANVTLERAYEQRPEAIPGGPAVMLGVRDTGHGMDEETRLRIFEPFFTTKAPGKGTGLGLATVYGIVRQSGGSITVFSEPGQGTTFRIYFPVAAAQEDQCAAGGPAAVTGGNETILVADDEEPVRRQLRRFLEDCGYRVLDAGGGLEAIEVASQHAGPIHLLISDLAMPGVSGLELARRLRIEREELRAILLSGYSAEAFQDDDNTPPWVTHLLKPAEPELIARTMREVLDGRR